MLESEKLFLGNRLVNIYKSLKILNQEYSAIKQILTKHLDTNGLVCEEGKIVFVDGNQETTLNYDTLRFILSSECNLGDDEIDSIISRSEQGKFRDDYIKNVNNI